MCLKEAKYELKTVTNFLKIRVLQKICIAILLKIDKSKLENS